MDRELGQFLVQFPGPIQFSLSRPRNRLIGVLDWITLPLCFLLMALTISRTPGWLSWLPPWVFLVIFLAMVGMLLSWLFHWLPYRIIAWSTFGMFLVVEGSHSEPEWTIFYFSIFGMIFFGIIASLEVVKLQVDPGFLLVDEHGFELKRFLSKPHRVQWANASNFEVEKKSTTVMYDSAGRNDTAIGRLRKALGNPKPCLPCIDGFTPRSLALFMTQWQERALKKLNSRYDRSFRNGGRPRVR